MRKALVFILGLGLTVPAAGAMAGPSLSEAWFVRKEDATAKAMLDDRADCVQQAEQFGVDRASDFSNPDYGSLSALGAALDEDALHGGAKQAVRRAVRDACMSKRGWVRVEVSEAEAKPLKKASARNPEALDAWMKANAAKAEVAKAEPAKPAAPPAAAPAPAPAAAATPPTPAAEARPDPGKGQLPAPAETPAPHI